MKTSELTGALGLLQNYRDKDGYDLGADHDVIYLYPTSRPLSMEDIQKMIDFGWHQEYDERDYDKDFEVSDYDPEESWWGYC